MSDQHKPKSAADRMRAYRARMRAAGLRPITLWAADARTPGFAEETRRQSLLASRHSSENGTMDFVETVTAIGDETA